MSDLFTEREHELLLEAIDAAINDASDSELEELADLRETLIERAPGQTCTAVPTTAITLGDLSHFVSTGDEMGASEDTPVVVVYAGSHARIAVADIKIDKERGQVVLSADPNAQVPWFGKG